MIFCRCAILLSVWCITVNGLGQSGISSARSVECLNQYFDILKALNNIRRTDAPAGAKIEELCQLLNRPSSDSPFRAIFEECPNQDRNNRLYTIFSDCSDRDIRLRIGKFLVDFVTDASTKTPRLLKYCVEEENTIAVKIYYEAYNETTNNSCPDNVLHRIAFVWNLEGDYFISEIRWATEEEIANACRNRPTSIPSLADDQQDQVKSLQAEVLRLHRQINKMTQERSTIEQNQFQLKESVEALERQSQAYRLSIDSLRDHLSTSGLDLKRTRSKLDLMEVRLQDNTKKQEALKDSINFRWRRYRDLCSTLDTEFRGISKRYLDVVEYYQKFAYSKTYFLGLNYGLIQAPYSQISLEELSIDPIRRSFNSQEFEYNFGLSLYHKIGGFISGVRLNPKHHPEVFYTQLFVDQKKEELFISGKEFTDLEYQSSSHNLKAFNIGSYLHLVTLINSFDSKSSNDTTKTKSKLEESPLLNGFFLMGGMSYLKGHVWDYYEGDFTGALERDESTAMYVIDKELVSSTGAIVGLAYVKPYFQVELGYNTLYRDYFFNIGANFPITNKTIQGKPIKNEVAEVRELRKALLLAEKTLKSIE